MSAKPAPFAQHEAVCVRAVCVSCTLDASGALVRTCFELYDGSRVTLLMDCKTRPAAELVDALLHPQTPYLIVAAGAWLINFEGYDL